MRLTMLSAVVLGAAVWAQVPAQPPTQPATQPANPAPVRMVTRGSFSFAYDERGISQLRHPDDPFGAMVTTPAPAGRGGGRGAAQDQPQRAATLGLTIAYQAGGGSGWTTVVTRGAMTASPEAGTVRYSTAGAGPLAITETYSTDGSALDWTIDLKAVGAAVRVGDLGISLPVQGPTGENPAQIFERGFLKHQFVSGAGSFFFYVRASGAPPFLLVTARPGTKLEVLHSRRPRGRDDVRPLGQVGQLPKRAARGGRPHTALDLKAGAKASYGFRLQWASSYEELRDLLYANGLFDVRVVPGMTVPSDLSATFSLRTRAKIESVTAEFPDQTTIASSAFAGRPRGGARRHAPLRGDVPEARREHADHHARWRPQDVSRVLRHRAVGDADQEARVVPGQSSANQGPDQVVGRRLRPLRHEGEGGAHDRRSRHLRRPHGLRPDVRRPRPGEGAVPRRQERHVPEQGRDRVARVLHHALRLGRSPAQRRRAAVSVRGLRHAELVREPRSRAAQGLRGVAGQRRHGEGRPCEGTRVAQLRLPARRDALLPHVPDREDVPRDDDLSRRGRLPQSRLGNRSGVLHLSLRDLPVLLRHLQMGSLQRARRPRRDRRARRPKDTRSRRSG